MPLFENPFGGDRSKEPKKPAKPKTDDDCGAGRKRVKGFIRKDGKKVASFCSRVKPENPTLSSYLAGTEAVAEKELKKMASELGCAEVAKKLTALSKLSKDPKVAKRAKERAEWLSNQPSCKIPRKEGEKK